MIFSKDEKSHKDTLNKVLSKLEAAGLSIALDKCRFGKKSIDYLGYQVDSEGLLPLEKKVQAIKDMPPPTSQKETLHYLGALNYFRSSLGYLPPEEPGQKKRSAAEVLMPLYTLGTCKIEKKTKFSEIWQNSPQVRKAFTDSKKLLLEAVRLNFPDPAAPLALTCDASLVAMGGVLEQFVQGS